MSVISDATNSVLATVVVTGQPYGVVYDSGKGEVFATCAAVPAHTLSVINDTTNTVVTMVKGGTGYLGVAYDSGLGEVLVTNYASNSISVFSDKSNKLLGLAAVGWYPFGIAYGPSNGGIYVTNFGQGTVSILSPVPAYEVKFKESGLLPGSSWSVTIDLQTTSRSGTSISLSLPNGTYAFTIAATGYSETSNPTSPLTVNGASVQVKVTFT